MKNKTKAVIGMLVIATLVAGSAFAEMGACPPDKMKHGFKDKMDSFFRELNLTPEQDKLLKEAKAAQRTEMSSLIEAKRAKMRELQKAIALPGVTRQKLEPLAEQLKSIEAQMVDSRIGGILKVKNILSPAQFQKLESMRENWQNKKHAKRDGKGW